MTDEERAREAGSKSDPNRIQRYQIAEQIIALMASHSNPPALLAFYLSESRREGWEEGMGDAAEDLPAALAAERERCDEQWWEDIIEAIGNWGGPARARFEEAIDRIQQQREKRAAIRVLGDEK